LELFFLALASALASVV